MKVEWFKTQTHLDLARRLARSRCPGLSQLANLSRSAGSGALLASLHPKRASLLVPFAYALYRCIGGRAGHGLGNTPRGVGSSILRFQKSAASSTSINWGLLFALTALSNFVALVAILSAGALLPHALLETPPLLWATQRYGFTWLASSAMLTITFILAVRFSSFLVPTTVGAVATVVGFVGINDPSFGPWWPWTLPGVVLTGGDAGVLIDSLLYSLVLASVFLVIGLRDFGRRDF